MQNDVMGLFLARKFTNNTKSASAGDVPIFFILFLPEKIFQIYQFELINTRKNIQTIK